MHFWIDKRANAYSFGGRGRVGASLPGRGSNIGFGYYPPRRVRTKSTMTPIHRFQTVDCRPHPPNPRTSNHHQHQHNHQHQHQHQQQQHHHQHQHQSHPHNHIHNHEHHQRHQQQTNHSNGSQTHNNQIQTWQSRTRQQNNRESQPNRPQTYIIAHIGNPANGVSSDVACYKLGLMKFLRRILILSTIATTVCPILYYIYRNSPDEPDPNTLAYGGMIFLVIFLALLRYKIRIEHTIVGLPEGEEERVALEPVVHPIEHPIPIPDISVMEDSSPPPYDVAIYLPENDKEVLSDTPPPSYDKIVI